MDKLSTFQILLVLSSFWNGFLVYFEKNQEKYPVVFSVLKNLAPEELTEKAFVLSCENLGERLFLEKKAGFLEEAISQYAQKKLKLRIVVRERKQKRSVPLLSFRPTIEDVFFRAGIRTNHRFDNFAVSSTNQVAYAAAQAVSKSPGSSYNPLFLYGGVGVGKTHLAQAVVRRILDLSLEKKVFFSPGDLFINELVESIKERKTANFRRKYRRLDLLVVDDIQFIAGKETIQEEFFHTFNAVISGGGQIILTSDQPPEQIKNLEDRLRSRFSGGLTVDIQPPDFELRTAILLIKANEKGVVIDVEAAKIVADQITDTRALEGSLLSIYAQALGKKDRVDLESVELFFQEKKEKNQKKISLLDVVHAVCSFYDVRPSQLRGSSREGRVALARQTTMFILRKELNMKLEEIAFSLKRKDHTTVLHGVNKISSLIIKNPVIKGEVDRIINSLTSST